MDKLFHRIFDFNGIRYPIFLTASVLSFIGSLYFNRSYPETKDIILWLVYGISIAMAFIWSIINYASHIKINSLYKKNDSIADYIRTLNLKSEEKKELKTYLSDFVKDLMENGKSELEAVRYAISQFQVEEFNSLTKSHNILCFTVHLYLIGFSVLFFIISAVTFLFYNVFSGISFWFAAISLTALLYAIAFILLIFIYQFANKIITKMMERY